MLEYLFGKRFGSKIASANGSGYFRAKPYKIQMPGNYPEESIQHPGSLHYSERKQQEERLYGVKHSIHPGSPHLNAYRNAM